MIRFNKLNNILPLHFFFNGKILKIKKFILLQLFPQLQNFKKITLSDFDCNFIHNVQPLFIQLKMVKFQNFEMIIFIISS